METEKKFKRGDVREDGKIFWGYNNYGRNEIWVTPAERETRLRVKREDSKRMLSVSPDYKKRQQESSMEWRNQNRGRYRKTLCAWREKNPGYTTKRQKESEQVRRATEVRGLLKAAMGTRETRDKNLSKTVRWLRWLQNRVGPLADSIDHLRPLSAIPLGTPEERVYANSPENTWILPADENRKKSWRMPTEQEILDHTSLLSEYYASIDISPDR